MLQLIRHHDFQLFLSPVNQEVAITNPPSFNWPQRESDLRYSVDLQLSGTEKKWSWQEVQSPLQPSFELENGHYLWRVTDSEGNQSDWFSFIIDETVAPYLAPTASELFEQCKNRSQFMMYFDEDIETVKVAAKETYSTLKATSQLAVDCENIKYPDHYKRGAEAGKRTAITNVREWIDRDLMSLALLYKIWQEEDSGLRAVELLLSFAQWSPEGPASLLRPCTWGDEVGLSLSRNLFLAYHWLSPLLRDSEKDFIRPMLVRIAYQMEDRLKVDEFQQFPGHSHTSRLPAYLGVAALVLHKEFDIAVCERWLDYSLMIYRGVLPFYGGKDGSWAEGAFYSSSYSKWQHPFFLSVERLSDFSFYEHPFYKNYCDFAMDFVASEQDIHPFGDGFWCKRESVEWPGFFAQNPLRIYAQRFGDQVAVDKSKKLESQIGLYALHLLDVIPTTKQIAFLEKPLRKEKQRTTAGHYYDYAGFGISQYDQVNLLFRASRFGNSSHRHADQGNLALIDNGLGVLTPTGSYGYCFGSAHHSQWTRTTQAHNLPLIGGKGQLIDDESAIASVVYQQQGAGWNCYKVDLSSAYQDAKSFIRTFVLVEGKGLIVWDSIELFESNSVQWRLHSHLNAEQQASGKVKLQAEQCRYECSLESTNKVAATIEFGYKEEVPVSDGIESDSRDDISHLQWEFANAKAHNVVVSCLKQTLDINVDGEQSLTVSLPSGKLIIDQKSAYMELG